MICLQFHHNHWLWCVNSFVTLIVGDVFTVLLQSLSVIYLDFCNNKIFCDMFTLWRIKRIWWENRLIWFYLGMYLNWGRQQVCDERWYFLISAPYRALCHRSIERASNTLKTFWCVVSVNPVVNPTFDLHVAKCK